MTLTFACFTWAFLCIGWFRPNWLRIAGAALMATGDAFTRFRVIFDVTFTDLVKNGFKPFPPSPSNPPDAPAISPVQAEVVAALIGQGLKKRAAEAAVSRALASIESTNPSFGEVFAKAAKEAA